MAPIPNPVAQAVQGPRSEPTVESVLGTLDSQGYAVVEDVLSSEAVDKGRAAIVEMLKDAPFGRNDFEGWTTKRVYALFAKTRALDEMATHPLVLGVLDRVLKDYQLG